MKEVKSPRKPLSYYYGIVLLVVILFNVFISPLLSKNVVEEVDYGTFMRMTEEKKIGRVEVEDSQILFTEKDNEKTIYKTSVMEDPGLTERLYASGAKFSKDIDTKVSPLLSILFTGLLPLLLLFTVAVIAALYWFFGTEKGGSIRATGDNPNMARAQGINTDSNIVLGLMLSNGLVALSGALLAQYQGSSDINMGRGAIVIGLAAVIISEVLFGRLFVNFGLKLFAVSIGAIVYYIVLQIVLQLGLNTNDLKLFTAIIVAIFLAVPHLQAQAKSSFSHAKKLSEKERSGKSC